MAALRAVCVCHAVCTKGCCIKLCFVTAWQRRTKLKRAQDYFIAADLNALTFDAKNATQEEFLIIYEASQEAEALIWWKLTSLEFKLDLRLGYPKKTNGIFTHKVCNDSRRCLVEIFARHFPSANFFFLCFQALALLQTDSEIHFINSFLLDLLTAAVVFWCTYFAVPHTMKLVIWGVIDVWLPRVMRLLRQLSHTVKNDYTKNFVLQ